MSLGNLPGLFRIQPYHTHRPELGVLAELTIPRSRKGGLSDVDEDAGKNT